MQAKALDPQTLAAVRQGFRVFNRYMLLLWRLGLGRWLNALPDAFGRYMVITHVGRRTGARRRTPVNFVIADGDVYCVAGFGPRSDWYRNVQANPMVELWLPDGWWDGLAADESDAPDRLSLVRRVLVASGFAAGAAGIDPVAMSDAELDAVTRDYRLIRIHRTVPRTGNDGPGDLAWMWPLATVLLLLVRPRRRR